MISAVFEQISDIEPNSLVFTSFITIISIITAFIKIKHHLLRSKLKGIRDAEHKIFPYIPLIGHGLTLSSDTEILYQQLTSVSKYHQENYPDENQFLLWFSPIHPVVCVYGAGGVEEVVRNKSYNSKSFFYTFMHNWLGTGLLTSNTTKWAERRRMLTPAFHFNILKNFVAIMNKNAKIMVQQIHEELENADGKTAKYDQNGKKYIEVDMFPKITLCALDIICEAAMGKGGTIKQVATCSCRKPHPPITGDKHVFNYVANLDF